jgi:hypothetical protein
MKNNVGAFAYILTLFKCSLFIVHDALVYVKHPASSLGLIFSRVNDFLFFHVPVDLQTSKQLGIKVLQKLKIVRCQHIAGKCS